jgi:hypothetical protein
MFATNIIQKLWPLLTGDRCLYVIYTVDVPLWDLEIVLVVDKCTVS